MIPHRAPATAALFVVIALLLAACGTQGTDPSSSEPASSASASTDLEESAAAVSETQPIDIGALTPGVRYVVEGTPNVSFVAGPETNAFPSPGGVQLQMGETAVRFATGIDEVYVEDGSHEPIGDVASVLEAFDRNARIKVNGTGSADLAGTDVAYVDATVPYYANEEGGGAIFSVASAPIVLRDLTTSRDDDGARRRVGGSHRIGSGGD